MTDDGLASRTAAPTSGEERDAPLILAIHEDTNANAALVRGARIIAAVAEERLSREKFQSGFPERAIAEVLRIGGVTLDEVDWVTAGNRTHFAPRLLGRSAIEGEHEFFGLRHRSWVHAQRLLHAAPRAGDAIERVNRALLSRRFGRELAPLVDHHTAHAYSAYLTSGFRSATAISIDNLGDGHAARVFRCRDGRCEPLWGSDAWRSPGQFYGEIAQLLGFHVLLAGKVTGLAAHGDPRRAYPIMERLFGLDRDDTDFRLAPDHLRARRHGMFAELSRMAPADVAAAAQKRLEDVLVPYAQRALRETGDRHVVLAGGVFGNVLVNQRIWNLPSVDGLFVHPAMSDLGIAAGAALALGAERFGLDPAPIPHVFLGPGYDEEHIGRLLDRERVHAERCDDIDERVAELVAAKNVVARFAGRLEYGPRALGHRSILYHTADPTVNSWLNARLQRSEFMPFGPSTLAEHAAACYEDYGEGVAHAARFMTLTLRCTDAMRRASPAVVHLDHTARPQIVHEEDNPDYYRVLRGVLQRTGVPSIVNTSFNMHGEPIVCSPEDALRCFRESRIDALAIGPFLVERAAAGG